MFLILLKKNKHTPKALHKFRQSSIITLMKLRSEIHGLKKGMNEKI